MENDIKESLIGMTNYPLIKNDLAKFLAILETGRCNFLYLLQ